MFGLLGSIASKALPSLVSFAAKKLGYSNIGNKIKSVISNP